MSSKAYRCVRLNETVLAIGIDVAKKRHVAVAEFGGEFTKPFSFDNSHQAFLALEIWVRQCKKRFGVTSVVVGLESTSHYGRSLVEWLAQRGLEVRMISTVNTKRAKEMLDNSPLKTDPKDAMVIADLLRAGKSRPLVDQQAVFGELRSLSELRSRLVTEQTACLNRLHRACDYLFPELPGLFSRLDGKAVLALLAAAPTPKEILKLGEEALSLLLAKESRGRLGQQRAQALLKAADTSIACQKGLSGPRIELGYLLPRLAELKRQRTEVERHMVELLDQVDYARTLLSVPYLGAVTTAVMLGELGDLRNYQSAKQVLKMAGLSLYERSSGQQRGQQRITKRGRAQLRRALFLAAGRMLAEGRPLASLKERYASTKSFPKLAVTGMRRLLKTLFAMVRSAEPFSQETFSLHPLQSPGKKKAA